MGSSSWTSVGGRLVRVSDQRDMDSQLVMVDQFVQRCSECQMHGDLIHVPPSELHALTSPWPFSVWGIDIIGKISPKSSSGHASPLDGRDSLFFFFFFIGKPFKKTVWSRILFLFYFKREKQNKKEKP